MTSLPARTWLIPIGAVVLVVAVLLAGRSQLENVTVRTSGPVRTTPPPAKPSAETPVPSPDSIQRQLTLPSLSLQPSFARIRAHDAEFIRDRRAEINDLLTRIAARHLETRPTTPAESAELDYASALRGESHCLDQLAAANDEQARKRAVDSYVAARRKAEASRATAADLWRAEHQGRDDSLRRLRDWDHTFAEARQSSIDVARPLWHDMMRATRIATTPLYMLLTTEWQRMDAERRTLNRLYIYRALPERTDAYTAYAAARRRTLAAAAARASFLQQLETRRNDTYWALDREIAALARESDSLSHWQPPSSVEAAMTKMSDYLDAHKEALVATAGWLVLLAKNQPDFDVTETVNQFQSESRLRPPQLLP